MEKCKSGSKNIYYHIRLKRKKYLNMNTVSYTNFSKNPKQYLEDIINKKEEILILKHNKPALKIEPYTETKQRNILRDSIVEEKDIISPINEKWDCE